MGCGRTKSPLENCADKEYLEFTQEELKQSFGDRTTEIDFVKKSYKEKMQGYGLFHRRYYVKHIKCEKERMDAPKTFDAKYQ